MINIRTIADAEYLIAAATDDQIEAAKEAGITITKGGFDANGEPRTYSTYLGDGDATNEATGYFQRLGSTDGKSPFDGIETGDEAHGSAVRRLMKGYHWKSGDVVYEGTKRQGETKSPGGYEIVLDMPKTMSIFTLAAAEGFKVDNLRIGREVYQATMQWAMGKGVFSIRVAARDANGKAIRDGKGKVKQVYEPIAECVMASYTHETNRNDDPHHHHHGVVFAHGVAKDGTIRKIDSQLMFQRRSAIAARSRIEQTSRYRDFYLKKDIHLGFVPDASGLNYELVGIPKEIAEIASSRRKDIQAAADERGIDLAKNRDAARVLSLQTRKEKSYLTIDDLMPIWQEKWSEMGWTKEAMLQSVDAMGKAGALDLIGMSETDRLAMMETNAVERIQGYLREKSTASIHQIEALTFGAIQYHALSGDEADRVLERVLTNPLLVKLDQDIKGYEVFTTQEEIDRQKNIVRRAVDGIGRHAPAAPELVQEEIESFNGFLKEKTGDQTAALKAEQEAMIRRAVNGDLVVLGNGGAGTGKTTAVRVVKNIMEKQGFRVYGTAIANKAKEGLAKDADLGADDKGSIAQLLLDYEKGKLKIDAKTLIIPDEAGMIATRDMEKLLDIQEATGCRLFFLGDFLQLPPIGVGQPFKAMIEQGVPTAFLVDVTRQKGRTAEEGEKMRAVSQLFMMGNADAVRQALEMQDKMGLIEWNMGGHDATIRQAAEEFLKVRQEHPDWSMLTTTPLNADVITFNKIVREGLKTGGFIGDDVCEIKCLPRGKNARVQKIAYAIGDRVLFSERVDHPQRTIYNSEFATIRDIVAEEGKEPVFTLEFADKTITATPSQLVGFRGDIGAEASDDRQATVGVPKMQHAYAATIYQSQGDTLDYHARIVLDADGYEESYVGDTRHRHQHQIFVDADRLAVEAADEAETIMYVGKNGMEINEEGEASPLQTDIGMDDIKERFYKQSGKFKAQGNIDDFYKDKGEFYGYTDEQKTKIEAARALNPPMPKAVIEQKVADLLKKIAPDEDQSQGAANPPPVFAPSTKFRRASGSITPLDLTMPQSAPEGSQDGNKPDPKDDTQMTDDGNEKGSKMPSTGIPASGGRRPRSLAADPAVAAAVRAVQGTDQTEPVSSTSLPDPTTTRPQMPSIVAEEAVKAKNNLLAARHRPSPKPTTFKKWENDEGKNIRLPTFLNQLGFRCVEGNPQGTGSSSWEVKLDKIDLGNPIWNRGDWGSILKQMKGNDILKITTAKAFDRDEKGNVSGDAAWKWTERRGAAGSLVDLVRIVKACDFHGAVKWVRDYLADPQIKEIEKQEIAKEKAFDSQRNEKGLTEFAQRDILSFEGKPSFVSRWLTTDAKHGGRGLEPHIVKFLGADLKGHSDRFTRNPNGCVIAHRDGSGMIVGLQERGAKQWNDKGEFSTLKKFHRDSLRGLFVGGDNRYWKSSHNGQAQGNKPQRVYYAETFIDAASLFQKDWRDGKVIKEGTMIVSSDGGRNQHAENVLMQIARLNPHIVWHIATDADAAGVKHGQDITRKMLAEGVARSENMRFRDPNEGVKFDPRMDEDQRDRASYKDWNQRLNGITNGMQKRINEEDTRAALPTKPDYEKLKAERAARIAADRIEDKIDPFFDPKDGDQTPPIPSVAVSDEEKQRIGAILRDGILGGKAKVVEISKPTEGEIEHMPRKPKKVGSESEGGGAEGKSETERQAEALIRQAEEQRRQQAEIDAARRRLEEQNQTPSHPRR